MHISVDNVDSVNQNIQKYAKICRDNFILQTPYNNDATVLAIQNLLKHR